MALTDQQRDDQTEDAPPVDAPAFDELAFDDRGLVPAVVQQHDTGEVLMVAYMSAESLGMTLERGETVFWSRSRQELWHKGATSGNVQPVVDIRYDCDGDCLLVIVDIGEDDVACHTGERTCFHRSLWEDHQ